MNSASLSVTLGKLEINEATAKTNDAARANTVDEFSKDNASLSRISLLPNQFTLTTSLKLQQALNSKNLDGSERMLVSSSNGVRATRRAS